jgi:sarcosine oxidase
MARDAGAKLMHGTAVLEIEHSPNAVRIHTKDETLTCDFLVVAAGGWLPKLLPELHLELSTERRVLAWFQARIAAQMTDGRFPVFCLDAGGGWYGMPTPDGRVKIGHDKHLRQRIDPDGEPIVPDAEDAEMLSGCVREFLVGFDEQPCEMKPCIYTLTEDHHFLIDRHPEHANVLVFSCCSGHGFKYAPVYGEIAADLIEGKPRQDLELFRLNRGHVAVTRFS